jgi:hypothetical protein
MRRFRFAYLVVLVAFLTRFVPVVSPDEPFVKMIAKPLPAATSWGSYLITLCPRAKRQI